MNNLCRSKYEIIHINKLFLTYCKRKSTTLYIYTIQNIYLLFLKIETNNDLENSNNNNIRSEINDKE